MISDIIVIAVMYFLYWLFTGSEVNGKSSKDVDFNMLEADKQRNHLSNREVQRNYAMGKYDKE